MKRAAFGGIVSIALTSALVPAAQADVVLQVSNGILTGATGVVIDSTTYDVAFRDGTCAALFSGCDSVSDFAFSDLAAAQRASQSLLDQVFVDDLPGGQFNAFVGRVAGCPELVSCSVLTPFGLLPSSVDTYAAVQVTAPFIFVESTARNSSILALGDFGTNGSTVYAVWSEVGVAQPIPEPGTLNLIAAGLLAGGVARRLGTRGSVPSPSRRSRGAAT